MRLRTVLWILALVIIFGFGWYKSYENQADRELRAEWDEQIQRLQHESRREFERLIKWIRSLNSLPNGRQQIVDELPSGSSILFREENGRDVASWMHPEYGIHMDFGFEGDRLVSHSAGTGDPSVIHPMPKPIASSSSAEHIRQVIVRCGPWVWLACLMIAMALPSHYGLIAAEVTLMAALACGVAWTVAPNYPITVRGIFSNDRLFFAAMMYVITLVVLAVRIAPLVAHPARPRSLQFGMRSLLSVMGLVAVLSAMGPLGYFAMCVFAVGGSFFFVLLQLLIGRRRAWSNTQANGTLIQPNQGHLVSNRSFPPP